MHFFWRPPTVWSIQIVEYVQYATEAITSQQLWSMVLVDLTTCGLIGGVLGGCIGHVWNKIPESFDSFKTILKFTSAGAVIGNVLLLNHMHWNAHDLTSLAGDYQLAKVVSYYLVCGVGVGAIVGTINKHFNIQNRLRRMVSSTWPGLEEHQALTGEVRITSYGRTLSQFGGTIAIITTSLPSLALLGGLWGVLEASNLMAPTQEEFEDAIAARMKLCQVFAWMIGSMYLFSTLGNSRPMESTEGANYTPLSAHHAAAYNRDTIDMSSFTEFPSYSLD